MSVENLKEYARRCASEPKLRDRAKELGVADIEGHMREARSMGLDFTTDDMIAFRKEVADAASGEDQLNDLSEEDLEKVAGGAVTAALAVAAGVGAAVGAAIVGTAVGGAVAASGQGGW